MNTLANLIYIYNSIIFLVNYINKTFIYNYLINYLFIPVDQLNKISIISRYLIILYNIYNNLSLKDYKSIINKIFSGFVF